MSGGAFDYAFSRVDSFACELQNRLDERDRKDEWGYTPNAVSDTAFAALKEIQREAERLAKLMREVEWFYSGDTGEDTFLARVEGVKHGQSG